MRKRDDSNEIAGYGTRIKSVRISAEYKRSPLTSAARCLSVQVAVAAQPRLQGLLQDVLDRIGKYAVELTLQRGPLEGRGEVGPDPGGERRPAMTADPCPWPRRPAFGIGEPACLTAGASAASVACRAVSRHLRLLSKTRNPFRGVGSGFILSTNAPAFCHSSPSPALQPLSFCGLSPRRFGLCRRPATPRGTRR